MSNLKQLFLELTAGSPNLSRRHVIILADTFRTSHQVLVERLEASGLAKPGSWSWFVRNGGITPAHIREALYGEVPR